MATAPSSSSDFEELLLAMIICLKPIALTDDQCRSENFPHGLRISFWRIQSTCN